MKLRLLTFNIHKGYDALNLNFMMTSLKTRLEEHNADIVFLQEVGGHHDAKLIAHQAEYLADQLWPHHAYGRNAAYPKGHHGNAILSRYPIVHTENFDLTLHRLENRGLLHVVVQVPGVDTSLHFANTHLNLREGDRQKQLAKIVDVLAKNVPEHSPLVLGGDFNDWRKKSLKPLEKLSLNESFLSLHGKLPPTFPSFRPTLSLDRVFTRGWQTRAARALSGPEWKPLSDHLALEVEIEL